MLPSDVASRAKRTGSARNDDAYGDALLWTPHLARRNASFPYGPLLSPEMEVLVCAGTRLVPRAEQMDIDTAIAKLSEKVPTEVPFAVPTMMCMFVQFESADNKPVVITYGVAALLALLFTEWFIHLPALDVVRQPTSQWVSQLTHSMFVQLLGFPIQLVGVLITPLLILRYTVDKEDWYADVEGVLEKVTSSLPGLKK